MDRELKYKTPSGSSAQSPERQKSPEELCKEAAKLIKIPDYLAALEISYIITLLTLDTRY
ncbi:hypothetical protein [Crocosphaera sp.]|uniref:hypothetical protein n=1 Tax=Crocosphaera sp. TaxID=2729996 RepID=UPI00257E0567|nr:hypothetical protein [Crocosphaera sp.]NQZ63531.1 hypothetical protein [Crocosphaera sp.]